MKFGNIFETHKIPDWYEAYLNYKLLKKHVSKFKKGVKSGQFRKLNGIYRVNQKFVVYHSDLFDKAKNFRRNKNEFAATMIGV
jgi:SPX domain protein involved in polyphosphate accumulation